MSAAPPAPFDVLKDEMRQRGGFAGLVLAGNQKVVAESAAVNFDVALLASMQVCS